MTWLAVRTFLGSPLGRALGAALALALLLWAVWLAGDRHGSAQERSAQAERNRLAAIAAQRKDTKAASISTEVKDKVDKARVEIQTKTEYLIKEVPKYVTVYADSKCVVPAGAVSLLNNAASGSTQVPAAPGGSVDADSGVSLSALTEVGVYNLGLGQQYRNEALGWREWYKRQAAEWSK